MSPGLSIPQSTSPAPKVPEPLPSWKRWKIPEGAKQKLLLRPVVAESHASKAQGEDGAGPKDTISRRGAGRRGQAD